MIQIDGDHVVARADKVFLDLLVGTLNGGNDGDDGRDADDNAQHGQHAPHLVSPDSLEGKPDIFYHKFALLSNCTGRSRRSPPWARPLSGSCRRGMR